MTDKAVAARARIDATKTLSLDERIHVLKQALRSEPAGRALVKALQEMGYEPMMFKQALDILLEE